MGKNQSASNLTNIIKQDASGNITFVSGSTTLMSVSSSGAVTTTGNVAGTASYASNAELLDGLDSTVFTLTSSFAAFTASQNILNGTYATTGSNTFAGIQTVNSNLVVTGSITAQTLVVQTITSSVDFVTGSTRFGSLSSNTMQVTGSVLISGSIGIGTIPSYTIDAFTPSGSGTGNLGRFYYNDGTYNPRLQITGDSTGITLFESFSTGANSLKFSIAGSNTLVLKGDNVGIGTTTPSASLDVNGTGRFTGPLTINSLTPFTASGGTTSTSGGFKYHTFNSSGTFQVTAGSGFIEVFVLGGGGAGGGDAGGSRFYSGGGGAGGGIYNPAYYVESGSYTVTIGAGGASNPLSNGFGGDGVNSVFSNITAIGGGGGSRGNGDNTTTDTGRTGGCGGGGGSGNGVGGVSTQAISNGVAYGNTGGTASGIGGGGGGIGSQPPANGFGGFGKYIFNLANRIGGGGGAGAFSNPGNNAYDGGGKGGYWNGSDSGNSSGTAGTANTGGGGGGIGYNLGAGGTGGSGIVIVRYKA